MTHFILIFCTVAFIISCSPKMVGYHKQEIDPERVEFVTLLKKGDYELAKVKIRGGFDKIAIIKKGVIIDVFEEYDYDKAINIFNALSE